MNDRILKATETAKLSRNNDVAIFVTDKEFSTFSYEETVKAEVVFNDLKTHTYVLFAELLLVLIMQLLGVKDVITLHRKVNASRKQM